MHTSFRVTGVLADLVVKRSPWWQRLGSVRRVGGLPGLPDLAAEPGTGSPAARAQARTSAVLGSGAAGARSSSVMSMLVGEMRCKTGEFVVELVSTIRAADSIDNPAPVIQVIERWSHRRSPRRPRARRGAIRPQRR